MKNEQLDIHERRICQGCNHRRLSWTAVMVGALVGVGLSFLLNLFATATGLALFTPNKSGLMTLAIGGFLALAIGAVVAMFVAGYTAGYLGRPYCKRRNLGVVYGFTAWSLALILTVLLTSHMGRYVEYYSNVVANPTMPVVTTSEHGVPATNMTAATPSDQKAANDLGKTTFLIFVLFFLGALSSCIGGHCGMVCWCNSDEDERRREDLPHAKL